MSPEQAAASIMVPNGFHVSLFASEPVIRQPIGLATDARGRLWVAENNTYSDARTNFDLTKHDRIVILEVDLRRVPGRPVEAVAFHTGIRKFLIALFRISRISFARPSQ